MSLPYPNFDLNLSLFLEHSPATVGEILIKNAKRYARFLEPLLKKSKLSDRQEIIARAVGFPDWHAFHTVMKQLPLRTGDPFEWMREWEGAWPLLLSFKEEFVPDDDLVAYLKTWGTALAKHSSLPQHVAMDVIAKVLGDDDWTSFIQRKKVPGIDDEDGLSGSYRGVFALSIFPDFSRVEAGLEKPPYVNHDKVDFKALAGLLHDAFQYGPPVSLAVANDTIDQVTFEVRMGEFGQSTGDPRMSDFAQKLLKLTPRPIPTVVDVRKAWRPLHVLQDRTQAPPPIMILFVIEAGDFEDAMIWFKSSWLMLGRDMVKEWLSRGTRDDEEKVGVLPSGLRSSLAKLFGCKFQEMALLSRVGGDPVPDWARIPM